MPVGRPLSALFGRVSLAGAAAVAFVVGEPTTCISQDLFTAPADLFTAPASQARKAKPTGIRLSVAGAAAMVSRYRRRHGLPAVRTDSRLTAIARRQARAMAARGRLSHNVAGAFGTRLRSAGYLAAAAGENLAAGQRSLAEAFAGWVSSPGHRSNLLLRGATRIGVAAAAAPRSRYRVFWAMVVAAPLTARGARGGGRFMQAPAGPPAATPEWQ